MSNQRPGRSGMKLQAQNNHANLAITSPNSYDPSRPQSSQSTEVLNTKEFSHLPITREDSETTPPPSNHLAPVQGEPGPPGSPVPTEQATKESPDLDPLKLTSPRPENPILDGSLPLNDAVDPPLNQIPDDEPKTSEHSTTLRDEGIYDKRNRLSQFDDSFDPALATDEPPKAPELEFPAPPISNRDERVLDEYLIESATIPEDQNNLDYPASPTITSPGLSIRNFPPQTPGRTTGASDTEEPPDQAEELELF
ncbi:hypothetical protein FRB97_007031 [Tulasnella sp. 331]|nr:hypothetical protein FRB97_007031 [Tulasnella sp. 331]